jgi:hypothetical protein
VETCAPGLVISPPLRRAQSLSHDEVLVALRPHPIRLEQHVVTA